MIKIQKLENINKNDMNDILNVWESSVRATHSFLSENDIVSLKPYVTEGANGISDLLCVRNGNENIIGFMGVQDSKIEMLFISDDYRCNGIGKKFIEYSIDKLGVEFVDVNEQNTQAVGFYEYVGFEVFKRSEFDEQGNPFPILHMKLK